MDKIDNENFVIVVRAGKRDDFHGARFRFSFDDDRRFLSIYQCDGEEYFPIAAFAKAVLYSKELEFLRDEAEKRELQCRRNAFGLSGSDTKPYKWGVYVQQKYGLKLKSTIEEYDNCVSEVDVEFITAEKVVNRTFLLSGLEIRNGLISLDKTSVNVFLDQCRYIHETIEFHDSVRVEFFDADAHWINTFLENSPRRPKWYER